MSWKSKQNSNKKISNKVRLYEKQSMLSCCTLFWLKTEILAYDFFDQSENSLCKLKAFHKWTCYAKNLLFWTTCFRHLWAFCWGFERTWNRMFLRSVLRLKTLRFQGISLHACAVPELARRRLSRRRILSVEYLFNQACNFMKNRLQQRCLTMKFAKF